MSAWGKVTPWIRPQRGWYIVLIFTGILGGFAESAILAVLAETATTIATGAKRAHIHLGPLRMHPTVDTLFLVALGLVLFRLLLQVPVSILPPRIITRIQAEMRTRLFDEFTRASWETQALDREGQLQETMTGQVGQATSAVQSAMGLVSVDPAAHRLADLCVCAERGCCLVRDRAHDFDDRLGCGRCARQVGGAPVRCLVPRSTMRAGSPSRSGSRRRRRCSAAVVLSASA